MRTLEGLAPRHGTDPIVVGTYRHPQANLPAAGGDGASSPDAVARWRCEKIGKR